MKIQVKPEGRENMWLVTNKDSLIAYIKSLNLEMIHNFLPTGFAMIGADHSVESVIEDIQNANDRVAVFTDKTMNMGHSLAIADTKLSCFDIGAITLDNLDIVGQV